MDTDTDTDMDTVADMDMDTVMYLEMKIDMKRDADISEFSGVKTFCNK
jgi:hypothetical protein